jgi:hypothetical protein
LKTGKEKKIEWGSERDYIHLVGEVAYKKFSALKAPRQSLLILRVKEVGEKVKHWEVKKVECIKLEV